MAKIFTDDLIIKSYNLTLTTDISGIIKEGNTVNPDIHMSITIPENLLVLLQGKNIEDALLGKQILRNEYLVNYPLYHWSNDCDYYYGYINGKLETVFFNE